MPEFVRAREHGRSARLVPSTTFNTAPTPELPFGPYGRAQVTSPIVGTVNLRSATKLTLAGEEMLPDNETNIFNGLVGDSAAIERDGDVGIPAAGLRRRSCARFASISRFRTPNKPSGYRFAQDGSRLWVNSMPAAGSRNIFTVLPGSTTLVPLTAANVGSLGNYLGVSDPKC